MKNLDNRVKDFKIRGKIMKCCFDYEFNFTSGVGIKILLGILALPVDTVVSILWIYILVPYVSFKRALQCAILGKEFHKNDNINFFLFLDTLGCSKSDG